MAEITTEDDQIPDKVVQEQIDMLKDSKSGYADPEWEKEEKQFKQPGLTSPYIEPDTTMKEVVEHTKKELIAKVTVPSITSEGQKGTVKVTKRAPRNKAAKQVVKSGSAEEIIAKMKEQITLIEYVNKTAMSQVMPDKLNKTGRELLLAMDKEITQLKNKYINQIQKL